MRSAAPILISLSLSVTSFLDHHQVPHYVAFGTLLGLVRGDRVIPWTMDNDVALSYDGLLAVPPPCPSHPPAHKQFVQLGPKLRESRHIALVHEHMSRLCILPTWRNGALSAWPDLSFRAIYRDKYRYVDVYEDNEDPKRPGIVRLIDAPHCPLHLPPRS